MTPDELRALAGDRGPWRLVATREDYGFLDDYDSDQIADIVQARVWGLEDEEGCLLFTIGGNVSEPGEDADARLIALAPDLARLCAEMGEALEHYASLTYYTPQGLDNDSDQETAEAALAKLSELKA